MNEIVVAGNWFLQPLANRMDRRHNPNGSSRDATPADYILEAVCLREAEAEVKDMIARCLPSPGFRLRSVRRHPAHGADQVDLQATFAAADRDDVVAEDAVRTLAQRPGVTFARWSIADEQAADWAR